MKFKILVLFFKYISLLCQDTLQVQNEISHYDSFTSTPNHSSTNYFTDPSNNSELSFTDFNNTYLNTSNNQELNISNNIKLVITTPKFQLVNAGVSNSSANGTNVSQNLNVSATNSTSNNTSSVTNSTSNNTSSTTNSTSNNTSSITNSTSKNNSSVTNSTSNNTSSTTNSTSNNTSSITNSTSNNASSTTNSTSNNTSSVNNTSSSGNNTNTTIDKSKWKLKYSVFLFRSAIDRTLPKMGNYFLESLKRDTLNKTYDFFSQDLNGIPSILDNLPQNKTIEKNISDFIVKNYLYKEATKKVDINNATFITYNKPNYLNFMSNILGLIINSNSSQHVIRDFNFKDFYGGAYTPNSIQLPMIVVFQKTDIIPFIGLKFRDTGVCEKLEVMKTMIANNPNFTDYMRKTFIDVIDSWNTTFTSLKMENLYKEYNINNEDANKLDSNIIFNTYKGLSQPLLLYEMVEQFIFDIQMGKLKNLQDFYINDSVERIYELRKFFLYELMSSSPIHNSILIEPLMDIIITLTNSFTDNSTSCVECNPITWINTYIIQADDNVFSSLNKFFTFGYYVNNTFFESYKSLPRIDDGYFLTFELWSNNLNSTDKQYRILIKDSSGLINKEYTISEFSHALDGFLYTPILNQNERKYYCGSK